MGTGGICIGMRLWRAISTVRSSIITLMSSWSFTSGGILSCMISMPACASGYAGNWICNLALYLLMILCITRRGRRLPRTDSSEKPFEANDPRFVPKPYYQVFDAQTGFLPNLSIIDLLFNMGPEGLLVLKESFYNEE